MYNYNCKIERVVDGDTVDVLIDLGFDVHTRQRVRIADIDAPESRTRNLEEKEKGKDATEFLKNLFSIMEGDARVWTEYDRRGKFGRVIGRFLISVPSDSPGVMETISVGDYMVEKGHAVYRSY